MQDVQALLKAGADVNTRDKSGMTPLMYAAFYDSLSVVKYLLKANGIKVNAKDGAGGKTALKYAASKKIISALKAAGAK